MAQFDNEPRALSTYIHGIPAEPLELTAMEDLAHLILAKSPAITYYTRGYSVGHPSAESVAYLSLQAAVDEDGEEAYIVSVDQNPEGDEHIALVFNADGTSVTPNVESDLALCHSALELLLRLTGRHPELKPILMHAGNIIDELQLLEPDVPSEDFEYPSLEITEGLDIKTAIWPIIETKRDPVHVQRLFNKQFGKDDALAVSSYATLDWHGNPIRDIKGTPLLDMFLEYGSREMELHYTRHADGSVSLVPYYATHQPDFDEKELNSLFSRPAVQDIHILSSFLQQVLKNKRLVPFLVAARPQQLGHNN